MMELAPGKAIFIDRDGTLILNRPYGCNPSDIEFIDGVFDALKMLQALDYRLIVITNQSGIARGYFTEEQLYVMHQRLAEMLSEEGITIDSFYYCPHHVDGTVAGYNVDCECRKPRPGMILRACQEHNIDPARSWMIGDILDDVEAGRTAGCRAVLIDLGTEPEPETASRTPEYVARDLLDAAGYVVAHVDLHADEEASVG